MMHDKKLDVINEFFKETQYKMIAVGQKAPSKRRAIAAGKLIVGQEIHHHIKNNSVPKGNVLALAEIAGVMGAKKTSEILPLCHPLSLEQVVIKTRLNEDYSVSVFCFTMTEAKTGVEMEALMGVNAALLCIYDLCKVFNQKMQLEQVRLLYKSGGKNGVIVNTDLPPELIELCREEHCLTGIKCCVVTISDRAFTKHYEDHSGPLLCSFLNESGVDCCDYHCLPDEAVQITQLLEDLTTENTYQLIITTGGTGIAPRDVTVDCIEALYDFKIPGFGELMRHYGAHFTPFSWLSRSQAGVIGQTLVINLPGSTKAVNQAISAFENLLPHALAMIKGDNHD